MKQFFFLMKFSNFPALPYFLSSLSDLANLVNIAAIKAAVEGAEKLTASQLEFAKDRIIMGTERRTMFVSEESKKVYAYHLMRQSMVGFEPLAYMVEVQLFIPRESC
jgi:ATP-dependent metalloprotease